MTEDTMTDIGKIFALDPLKLTKDDPRLQQMIEYFRSRRHLFNSGVAMAGKTKPATAKEAGDVAAAGEFKLGDLGL